MKRVCFGQCARPYDEMKAVLGDAGPGGHRAGRPYGAIGALYGPHGPSSLMTRKSWRAPRSLRSSFRLGRAQVVRLPNFLVIGAAKSATTALHEYLAQHPDIYMSPVKEPNFFAFEGQMPHFRGPSKRELTHGRWTRDQLRNARYEASISSLRHYQRLFARVGTERAIGESSVSYMYIPDTAERIRRRLPGVRLIALLRHPADRAYSKFTQFRRDGLEPISDFAKALEAESERVAQGWSPTWYYKRRGFYYDQLKPYYDIFDRARIKVFLHEDFQAGPAGVLREIFRFLEVDDRFVPDTTQRHNVSAEPVPVPKSRLVDLLLNTQNPVRSAANWLFPSRLLWDVRRRLLAALATTVESRPHEPMPSALRRQLIEEYRSDILKLGGLIGRDLSRWLA
jgi:sulfotransferase family protein